MKKTLSIVLLLSLVLSLSACGKGEPREIDCSDIIKAYEDAGYSVTHTQHCNEEGYHYRCFIAVQLNEQDDPSDHLYITTYWTEEEAKQAERTDRYHIVTWIFALPFGEYRWLKSGTYGTIEYSTYNRKMLKPFKKLTK